jgi:hypothetical protein
MLVSAALVLAATPAIAQDEAGATEATPLEVSGIDYAFVGLPTSVPAGTELAFRNDGTEYHEMIVVRLLDEVTPLEELMALPEEETADLSQFVGYLATLPRTAADGAVAVAEPGRYIATCLIRQGSDPAAFEAIGFDPSQLDDNTDPSTLSPEVQELLAAIEANPQHQELGMFQEFTVTEVGPMPEAEVGGTAPADEESNSG